MKKLLIGALLAVIPALGINSIAANLAPHTEITIRPLQPGISVESGVLGTEVQFELNGRKIVNQAIYLTGTAAATAVAEANQGLKLAGSAARYTFDASKQMIVITGSTAADLIEKFAKKGLDLASQSGQAVVNGTKAVAYETKELAAVSVAYARLGLVSAVTYAKDGYEKSVAVVKVIAKETSETAKDAAIVTYNAFLKAAQLSKDVALDTRDAAIAAGTAALVYVNDAGVFVYDHSKEALYQIGKLTEKGLALGQDAIEVTLESASKLQKLTLKGLKSIYKHLPRLGITIDWN